MKIIYLILDKKRSESIKLNVPEGINIAELCRWVRGEYNERGFFLTEKTDLPVVDEITLKFD